MSFETIFKVSLEEKLSIDKFYNISKSELKFMMKSFDKWIGTQLHLPQNQEPYFLEMMLKLNKFNEDKVRRKIDMYYSMRNIIPEFYECRSPICSEMKSFMDTFMILPLPQLTPALERIYLVKFLDSDPSKYDLIQNARYLMAMFDIRLKYDEAVGERYIYDLSGLRLGHILKVNPMVVKKIYTAMEKAYSDRIKGIHFLNMPLIGNALISLAKMVLSEKLANRVQSHRNLDSLNELFPVELLPSDYNGCQESSEILYGKWRESFENSAEWIEEIGNQKSDESLRVSNEETSSVLMGLFNILRRS